MKRLTTQVNIQGNSKYFSSGMNTVDNCLNKLGQLEDVEEELELNINLLMLLKIANEGFWFVNDWRVCSYSAEEILIDIVDQSFKYIYLNDCPNEDENCWYKEKFSFDDFGKTYFLTKEEAEKAVDEYRAKGIIIRPNWEAL